MTDFLALAEHRFVSLTTYRKSGAPVSVPVWIARDGDSLLVTTPAKSGKVRRLRDDPRVELVPCGRSGRVQDHAARSSGVAVIEDSRDDYQRLAGIFRRKMPIEYRLVMAIERLVARGDRFRVILRISPR